MTDNSDEIQVYATSNCSNTECGHPLSCHTGPPLKPEDKTVFLYCARTTCDCVLTASLGR